MAKEETVITIKEAVPTITTIKETVTAIEEAVPTIKTIKEAVTAIEEAAPTITTIKEAVTAIEEAVPTINETVAAKATEIATSETAFAMTKSATARKMRRHSHVSSHTVASRGSRRDW